MKCSKAKKVKWNEAKQKKSERETHIFATITSPLPSTSDECKIHIRETKEEEFLQDVLN